LLSRDRHLEPFICYLFAPICRKYAGLAAWMVGKSPERC
jgi:hypothetical protein